MAFAVEVLLKASAESQSIRSFGAFLADWWNLFDLVVLVVLGVFLILGDEIELYYDVNTVTVVRALRILRATQGLRAANVMPQLALVMETTVRAARSVMYIRE